jgi:hypothetical protein
MPFGFFSLCGRCGRKIVYSYLLRRDDDGALTVMALSDEGNVDPDLAQGRCRPPQFAAQRSSALRPAPLAGERLGDQRGALAALRPNCNYPVLGLAGEQGSGAALVRCAVWKKSAFSRASLTSLSTSVCR